MSLRLSATDRASALALRRFATSNDLFTFYRKSKVPEGGWTHESFAGRARAEVHADMRNIRRAAILRGTRSMSAPLAKMMREQVERVIDIALNATARLFGVPVRRDKGEVEFEVPNYASLWEAAIRQEMDRADLEVIAATTPIITSVAADTFHKVNVLLGAKPTQQQINALNVRTRTICAKVTNINETTRTRLRNHVVNGIREGMTVYELAEDIRKNIPSIATNRVPTIVRTELGRAVDEGTKHAMRESGIVTHFSVIGCTKIEPRGPTLLGWPTCNLEGVPIEYENEIEFHHNHTGCIVMDGFRRADGSVPNISLGSGAVLAE